MPLRIRPAARAWIGLTGYIIAADVVLILTDPDHETMSSAFRDAIRHPIHRIPIILAWSYVTAHLFLELPHDPLTELGRLVEKFQLRGVQAQ